MLDKSSYKLVIELQKQSTGEAIPICFQRGVNKKSFGIQYTRQKRPPIATQRNNNIILKLFAVGSVKRNSAIDWQ
jgi:hypothetical protein